MFIANKVEEATPKRPEEFGILKSKGGSRGTAKYCTGE